MRRFPNNVITAAILSHAKFYPKGPFVSIDLAQWALESDYGESLSGKNNCFGIKATEAQIAAGKATLQWTHETIGGVYTKVRQYFADYDDIVECFNAHAELLATQPNYVGCQRAQTPGAYAMALQNAPMPYATGIPGHPYGEALIAIITAYDLDIYDPAPPWAAPNPIGAAPAVASPAPPAPITGHAEMFSFASILSMLQVIPEVITEGENLLKDPAVLALEAFFAQHFTHTTTPGSAAIIEPKAPAAR